MKTSVESIYACGDAVEFRSAVTGRNLSGKLATNAVPMAKVLAENLSGNKMAYAGFYNGAATRVNDYYIGGTGLTEQNAKREGFKVITGYGEATTKFPVMPGARKIRVKLIADAASGRIIGGQIVSGEPVTFLVDLITLAMQNAMTADGLTELSYSAQPYQSFFPAGNVIVMAAESIVEQSDRKGSVRTA
jgi:NADPH-dependent 2,4-dienoyl-CoA reductase/sulfur reductase-like enzyme